MKPYVFSKQKHKKTGQGWVQDGTNVNFGPAKLRYDFVYDRCRVKALSRLSFDYNFEHEHDEVWFAYCIPYTYSYLLKQLSQLQQKDENGAKIMQHAQNGRSLMGIPIHVLKITDSTREDRNKKVIVATGRVHPGETNGSIVMSGLMKYLCSPEAAELRKHAVFILVPMMNPDGVVMGNYRTGASGKDLNRVYTRMNKQVYPEIFYMRTLMKKLVDKTPVFMFLDLHGHSSKKNTFFYGPSYPITEPEYYKAKVLPKILSNKTPIFRYYSCVFRLAESKKETARAVMLQIYRIPYVYTVESSNGFYYDPQTKITHEFNLEKFIQLGYHLGVSLSDHVCLLTDYEQFLNQRREGATRKRAKRAIPTVQKKFRERDMVVEEETYEEPKLPTTTVFFMNLIDEIKNDEKTRKQSESDEDSDSDNEQEDLQPEKLAQFNKILVKDYEINTIVDSMRQKQMPRQQNVRVKQQPRPIKKSKQDTDFEMQLINQVIDRKQYSAAEKRKYSTSVKEKREYVNRSAKEYKKEDRRYEKPDQELLKQPIKQYIQPVKVQFNYEVLDAAENKSQEQPPESKPLVITVNRYSDKKLRRQQRLDSADHLSNSLFDFEVAQYPTGVFTLPMRKLPIQTKKKKSVSQTHQKARLFSSYGNSRQHSKSNIIVEQQPSGIEFNFSRLLRHPAVTPNVAADSKLKDYRSFKTVFPSSFYRIKQQIKNRRREYPYDLEDNALALDIRKVGH